VGVQIQALRVLEPDQFQRGYAAMTKERAQALIIFSGSFTAFHRKELLELAAKIRIPTICGNPEWSEAGGLIAYGHDRRDQFRRAARIVDRIVKGARPAEIPIEQPTKFELVINLKTAKQIGLTIPQKVLARADRVIRRMKIKSRVEDILEEKLMQSEIIAGEVTDYRWFRRKSIDAKWRASNIRTGFGNSSSGRSTDGAISISASRANSARASSACDCDSLRA
jgi:ABC transporter substrate binding protein